MKINQALKVIYLIVSIALLVSCKKEKTFAVKIVNQTNYDISQLSFSGIVSAKSLSVQSTSESETVVLSYPRRFRTMPKLMNIYIDSFDDQGNSYSTIIKGTTLPFSYRETSETENLIFLTSSENQDTLEFSFYFD